MLRDYSSKSSTSGTRDAAQAMAQHARHCHAATLACQERHKGYLLRGCPHKDASAGTDMGAQGRPVDRWSAQHWPGGNCLDGSHS